MANERLRVGLCITDLDIGGAERCLVQLATRVDRERFEPAVFCLGPPPKEPRASCEPPLRAAGIELHFLGARTKWQFPSVLRRLTRLLAQKPPHVLQTFLFHANVLGRIAARRAGVPRVACGIRVAERGSRWHTWLERRTDRLVDRYVCVSQAVARFSLQQAGLPEGKLAVIPNGIDAGEYPSPEAADLAAFGVPQGRGVVTYVGRLDRQKGVDWLLHSASAWLGRLTDVDLLLVGDGPRRGKLERLCRRTGLSDRVHFAGWRPDVPAILAASRMLVLPSQWEGMPNVVLEAMASGLPVVATEAEGVAELLGPGAGAQTVRHGETETLVDKIVTLISDPAGAATLGEANRRRAAERFSIHAMIAAYERLWECLVKN